MSLYDKLSENSITTEHVWDLEENHLIDMGINLVDRLKFTKAKQLREEKLRCKLSLFYVYFFPSTLFIHNMFYSMNCKIT